MGVIVKKTTELTDAEIEIINDLFNEIFNRERTVEYFKDEYLNTPLGYSYHAMLYEDEKLIGFHSGLPFYYFDGNRKFIAGLGVDTMTAIGHRDFFNVRDLFISCEDAMRLDGCVLRIGFPNDKSYPILKKGFKYRDIGKMDTFFLPLRIGGIKQKFNFLNPLSQLFSWFLIQISKISISNKVYEPRYVKDRSSFNQTRYKWFGGDYKHIIKDNIEVHYRVQNHDDVKTAFILDVYPISKYAFNKAIREVYRAEKANISLIMYVGNLPFSPLNLVKMPRKWEPKHFNFTCKPLIKGYFDDSIYDINNWSVNLSNYDLL